MSAAILAQLLTYSKIWCNLFQSYSHLTRNILMSHDKELNVQLSSLIVDCSRISVSFYMMNTWLTNVTIKEGTSWHHHCHIPRQPTETSQAFEIVQHITPQSHNLIFWLNTPHNVFISEFRCDFSSGKKRMFLVFVLC